ncbi:MAG: maleylpyruvate isomerase family mycothiol-dependent enzyme [Chloroflexota bacterium]
MSVDPKRSVELLQPCVEELSAEIEALSADEWQHPSNLPEWRVAELSAHVVRNGESVLLAVKRALVGDPTPAFGKVMVPREQEILASGQRGCAELQRREAAELLEVVGGLRPEQFDLTSPHAVLPLRPVWWFCNQRLIEVLVHAWDLHHSLGRPAEMPSAAASYALPFLVEENLPLFAARRPRPEGVETFRLVADEGLTWWLSDGPGGPEVQADSGRTASTEIAAPAGALALAIYGRVPADEPPVRVKGPAGSARRFRELFGG